jgi:beta-glucanase (GH16 family)
MKAPRHQIAPARKNPLRSLTWAMMGTLGLLGCGTLTVQGGWKLVWSDEFNGALIDTNHWKFETGNHRGWGNHELEYYTGRPENAYVSNGFLHIVARRESTNGFSYTSARMKTEGLFAKQYGRFEFRAKFPAGQGFWPAFWLMPEDSPYGGWPACGEIDIVENKGNYPAVVQGTIHYADSRGGYLHSTGLYTFLQNDGVTNLHTYGLDWTTNSIQWFVDGKLYQTQDRWTTVKAPYPAPFDQPFYIIMNLAVGGDYGSNPETNTVFPGEIQVDYVRVYEHSDP